MQFVVLQRNSEPRKLLLPEDFPTAENIYSDLFTSDTADAFQER